MKHTCRVIILVGYKVEGRKKCWKRREDGKRGRSFEQITSCSSNWWRKGRRLVTLLTCVSTWSDQLCFSYPSIYSTPGGKNKVNESPT